MKINRIMANICVLACIGLIESHAYTNTTNLIVGFSDGTAQVVKGHFEKFSNTGDIKHLQDASGYYFKDSLFVSKHPEKKGRLDHLKRTIYFLNNCHSQRDTDYDPYDPPAFGGADFLLEFYPDKPVFVLAPEVAAEKVRRGKKFSREMGLLRLVEQSVVEIKEYRDSLMDEADAEERKAALQIIETETVDSGIRKRLLEEPLQSELERITAIHWEYYQRTGNMRQLTRLCSKVCMDLRNKSFRRKNALNELHPLLDAVVESHNQKRLIEEQPIRTFTNPAKERSYKRERSVVGGPLRLGSKYIPEYLERVKTNNPEEYGKAVEMIRQTVQDKELASRLIGE